MIGPCKNRDAMQSGLRFGRPVNAALGLQWSQGLGQKFIGVTKVGGTLTNLVFAKKPKAWDGDRTAPVQVIVLVIAPVLVQKSSRRNPIRKWKSNAHHVTVLAFIAPALGFFQMLDEDLTFAGVVAEQVGIQSRRGKGDPTRDRARFKVMTWMAQRVPDFDGT